MFKPFIVIMAALQRRRASMNLLKLDIVAAKKQAEKQTQENNLEAVESKSCFPCLQSGSLLAKNGQKNSVEFEVGFDNISDITLH